MDNKTTMQQPDLNQEQVEPKTIDIEVLLSLIFLGKRTIIFTSAACVLAALMYLMILPNKYEARVKVLAEPVKDSNPLALELRSYQEWRTFIETQKEIVVSDSVLRSTIAAVNEVAAEEVTQQDLDNLARKVVVSSRSSLGASLFNGDGIGESNTFFITAYANTPDEAAKIANTMVEQYKVHHKSVRNAQAENALQLTKESVKDTSEKTNEAHARLVEFEKDAGNLLPELLNIDKPTLRVFPELEDLRSEYELKNIELHRRKALVKALGDALKTNNLSIAISGTVIPTSITIDQLRNQQTKLQIDLVKLRPFYQEDSREIQNVKQQIADLEKTFSKLIEDHLNAEKKAVEILVSEQSAREEALTKYQTKLEKLSLLNCQHAKYKREYESLVNVLNKQMENLVEAEASANNNIAGANIAVVDMATPPTSPVNRHPLRTIFLALIVGFGIGLVIVLSTQAFRPVFVNPRQLAEFSGVTVTAIRYDNK